MARLGERLVPRLRGRGAWRGSPCPAGGHAAAARARTREDVTAARYGAIRVHNTIVQRFRATRVHSIPYVVIAVLQYDQARCKRRSASGRAPPCSGLVPRWVRYRSRPGSGTRTPVLHSATSETPRRRTPTRPRGSATPAAGVRPLRRAAAPPARGAARCVASAWLAGTQAVSSVIARMRRLGFTVFLNIWKSRRIKTRLADICEPRGRALVGGTRTRLVRSTCMYDLFDSLSMRQASTPRSHLA